MCPAAPPLPIKASDWRIGVWRSFLRAHARVVGELEAELGARAGLALSWYDVLLQLAEAPNRRLRMADLAELDRDRVVIADRRKRPDIGI